MRKTIWIGISAFLFIGFMTAHAYSAPIVLKGVTAFPPSSINNDGVAMFVEKVNKRAAGRLQIDWVGGPEVIKTHDQIHALKAGTIDMLMVYSTSYMKSLMPVAEARILNELMPWEMRKAGTFNALSEIFARTANAKYIGTHDDLSGYQLFSNKKIEKIEDFAGLKIRCQIFYMPAFKALGATPASMPPSELYTAMERGVVDGFTWPKIGMTSLGLQEITKYVIEPSLFRTQGGSTLMNLDKWNKIPKDLQEMIMDVMADMEYITAMRDLMIAEREEKLWAQAGMKFLHLPPEDANKLIALVRETIWETVSKKAPEDTIKLKKVFSRDALPKGTFPWQ